MATSVGMPQQRYFTSALHMGNSNIYTRPSRPQQRRIFPSSVRGERTLQQGVNETLKEAALINIVAAVNEGQDDDDPDRTEISAVPGSAIDSLSNTMAVISNLMNARRRTVSIPKTSKVAETFNLPQNTTQKKPVYYKHSNDEEVTRGEHHMAMFKHMQSMEDSTVKSSPANQSENRKPAKEVIIRSLPTRPHTVEYNSMHNINFQTPTPRKAATNKATAKERESETRLSVRKLGSIKRTVHKIPKCDAVDFSDTGNNANLQEIFRVFNVTDHQKEEKGTKKSDMKYYRTKSLPSMFPSKTAPKESTTPLTTPRNVTSVARGRLHSRSTNRTQRTPDSLYKRTLNMPSGFGFEKLAIYNGLNQNPDIVSPVEHDSKKPPTNKHSFSGIVTQRSNWKQRPNKYPHLHQNFKDDEDTDSDVFLTTGKRVFFTESVDDFRDAVKSAMNGTIDSQYEEVVYSVTPSGISSSMDIHNTQHGGKNDRHVQFVRRRFLSDSSDDSNTDDKPEEDNEEMNTYHDARMIHAPVSTSVSYPPISASQLLRIQQKIIPANIKTEAPAFQPYFSAASSMTLQKFERQRSDLTFNSRSKSFVKSEVDADEIEIKVKEVPQHRTEQEPPIEQVKEEQGELETEFTSLHDMACSPVGRDLSTAASKTRPGSNEKRGDDGFYKLVKAVDTHSYAEYEHKKLRRLPPGVCGKALDHQTTEFVKVKL